MDGESPGPNTLRVRCKRCGEEFRTPTVGFDTERSQDGVPLVENCMECEEREAALQRLPKIPEK